MRKIILASTSPRRRELLEKIGLEFEVLGSDYEEDMSIDLEPLELAKYLSLGKAKAVAKDYQDYIIIAADTFVVLGKKLLGKPGTPEKAVEMLREISGKNVSSISGVTIIDTGSNTTISKSIETNIFIKKLSESEIQKYVASGEPLDKAGAFAIQGLGSVMIEKIEGDYCNIM